MTFSVKTGYVLMLILGFIILLLVFVQEDKEGGLKEDQKIIQSSIATKKVSIRPKIANIDLAGHPRAKPCPTIGALEVYPLTSKPVEKCKKILEKAPMKSIKSKNKDKRDH